MKKYLCKYPGCSRLVDTPHTYCDIHVKIGGLEDMRKADARSAAIPFAEARRTNEEMYHGKWKRFSAAYRKRHPICEIEGCGSPSESVHHISNDPEYFFDEYNLIAVCALHHNSLSAIEANKRKHMR